MNLARAVALEPALLLLDEPAAALDPESRAAFLADVEQALGARTTTVVHVSQRACVPRADRPCDRRRIGGRRPAAPARRAGPAATVQHVSPGPRRWEITLTAPMPMRAHVPLGTPPPRPGDRLAARLDPALAAVLSPVGAL